MARLSLSLLGPFQATLDGEPITGFESNKARALLAYLAVESGRPYPRETLAGLLWPERPNPAALGSLRHALANLRQILRDLSPPPFLLVTRETLQFNPASDHSLDTADFQQQIASSKLQMADCNLQSAIGLYRGQFLEGFSVEDSPAFEEWALLKREQLDREMLAALQRLADYHGERGEYESAQAHVRRQLALEPWREESHRQLVHLLALNGQRSAALAQYKVCRRLLADELGVEPERATVALVERIRGGLLSRGAEERGGERTGGRSPLPPRSSAPSLPSLSALFVARERELAQLAGYLELARAGAGRVVFVTGEAGSGKTALLNEFARRAIETYDDLVVAGGRCSAPAGSGDPYLPFRDILRMLAGDIEAQRTSGTISPEHARRLWALMPALAQALVDVGPDLVGRLVSGADLLARAQALTLGRADAGAAWLARVETLVRHKSLPAADQPAAPQPNLFEQVTNVLQALARQQTLVLVLDDLQWVDTGSLSLLFHLGQRLAPAGSRILIMGAYRPEDVARGRRASPLLVGGTEGGADRHPLVPILHEFQRMWGTISVDLDQAEGRAFVEAFLDSEPNRLGTTFREALYRHTGGQALFTVELLRGLQEHGDLVRDETGRWMEGPTLDWDRLPARVEAVIAERVGQLPPEWQALLTAASVEGEVFTAEVVARVQGMNEDKVVRGLSGALSQSHQLVTAHSRERLRPGGQCLSRYRFRHHLFQRYLYQRLDLVEQARLHEATGRAIEWLLAANPAALEAEAGQLARHFAMAGLPVPAAAYHLRAGVRAVRLMAYEEAIRHLRQGVAQLATMPESPERMGLELDLHLALNAPLQFAQGFWSPERAAVLARVYELAQHPALAGSPRREAALALVAHSAVWSANSDQALVLGGQLLDLAQANQDPQRLLIAHWLLGFGYSLRSEFGLALEHLDQALACYDRESHGPLALLYSIDLGVFCLVFKVLLLWLLGYPDQASQASEQALQLADETAHPPSVAFARLQVAASRCLLGRDIASAAHLMEGLSRPSDIGAVFNGLADLVAGQRVELPALGDEHGTTNWLRQPRHGLETLRSVGPGVGRVQGLLLLAGSCAQAGQVEEGLVALDEALVWISQSSVRPYEAEVHRLRGELLLKVEGGRMKDEAETCFQRAIELARQQQARWLELRATVSLARLWQEQDRAAEDRAKLADIYGWFMEGFDTPDLVEARALLETISLNRQRGRPSRS